jgi:hypothetical protein
VVIAVAVVGAGHDGANPARQIRVSTDVTQELTVEGPSMLHSNFSNPWSHRRGRGMHGVRDAHVSIEARYLCHEGGDAAGDRRVGHCALGASSSDVGPFEDGEDWLADGDLDLRTLISSSR